jgi:putative transposase
LVADSTNTPVRAWFLYLTVALESQSRPIAGWAMVNPLRTEPALPASDVALEQQRPDGVIYHSNQDREYTPIAFNLQFRETGGCPVHRQHR